MGDKLNNIIHFFVDGVTEGRLRSALDQYVSFGLIEHGPGTGPGRGGLAAAYAPLITRYDRRFVQPIRGFEDGRSVLLHTFQSYGYGDIERVCFDIVDTDDDDRITEHWSVSAPLTRVTRAGYSQIDGPTMVEDDGATALNKRVVSVYTADVIVGRNAHHALRYLTPDCVDHDPNASPPQPGLPLTGQHTAADSLVRYQRVVRLIGHGNFAATLSDVAIDGKPGLVCDLYRLRDGRVVEHWNAMQPTSVPASPLPTIGVRSAPAIATVGVRPPARRPIAARGVGRRDRT